MNEGLTKETKTVSLVRINYKSGNHMEVWCEKFSIKHRNGVLTEVDYQTVVKGVKPLYIGSLESIDSIWQMDTKQVPLED